MPHETSLKCVLLTVKLNKCTIECIFSKCFVYAHEVIILGGLYPAKQNQLLFENIVSHCSATLSKQQAIFEQRVMRRNVLNTSLRG